MYPTLLENEHLYKLFTKANVQSHVFIAQNLYIFLKNTVFAASQMLK